MSQLFLVNTGKKSALKKRNMKKRASSNKPKGRKASKKKLKGAKMAKKRKPRKNMVPRRNMGMKPRKNTTKRRNPGALAKRIMGMSPKNAVKNALMGQPGMLMAQLFAKQFGGQPKSFFEPGWTWDNYLWAFAGAFASGVAGNMLLPGKGQVMFEHGAALTLNKLIQDKLIQPSDTLRSALGRGYGALGSKYSPNYNALNPPAAVAMRKFDMYGNPLKGPIVPESYNMGGPVVPVRDLGAKRFTNRQDLGRIDWAGAFTQN